MTSKILTVCDVFCRTNGYWLESCASTSSVFPVFDADLLLCMCLAASEKHFSGGAFPTEWTTWVWLSTASHCTDVASRR